MEKSNIALWVSKEASGPQSGSLYIGMMQTNIETNKLLVRA